MSRRGVTLLELLIATVISAIAMFALVPPFLAEGNLFRQGQRQTEAQRYAQLAMRAMARVARESARCEIDLPYIKFYNQQVGGCSIDFGSVGGRFEIVDSCAFPPTASDLIDGARSKVVAFVPSEVVDDRLVHIQLRVTHALRIGDAQTE